MSECPCHGCDGIEYNLRGICKTPFGDWMFDYTCVVCGLHRSECLSERQAKKWAKWVKRWAK